MSLEPLSESLPLVRTLATKVGRVHGAHNPNLVALATAVMALDDLLAPHLEAGVGGLAADRDEARSLLQRIRTLSDDFTVPSWGCSSYRTLFAELKGVDAVVSSALAS